MGSSCYKVNMNRAVRFPSDSLENGDLVLSVPISKADPFKGSAVP